MAALVLALVGGRVGAVRRSGTRRGDGLRRDADAVRRHPGGPRGRGGRFVHVLAGLVKGTSATLFSPEASLTRAQSQLPQTLIHKDS